MKNQLRLWGMIPLVLLGLAACNKDDVTPADQGKGNVKITFGFDQETGANGPATAAVPASGKKPTTSWAANVKDLVILFAKTDGTIEDARRIDVPTATDITTPQNVQLKNIPAGTYNTVIIANSGQADNIVRNWTPEGAKTKNLSSLLMNLVSETMPTGITGTGYKEPAEIFYANQSVTVQADKDNTGPAPFALKRAVSLIRVRLVPVGDNKDKIDFTTTGKGGAIFFRKVQTTMTAGNVLSGRGETKGIYIGKPFLASEPTTGYTGTGNILGNGVTCYRDFLSFPGGSKTVGTEKFDIMIMGMTKDNTYIPTGSTDPVAKDTPIYWSGPISEVAAANGILEVVITVQSVGEPTVPEVGSYGNLTIQVNVSEWGNVTQYEMPV